MNLQYTLFCISFVELLSIPLSYSLKNKDKPCHQFSICKCIFPTGRGLNLEPIDEIMSASVTNSFKILLHLCGDVTFKTNATIDQCNQTVSVCAVDDSQSLFLGKAENLKIISSSEFQPISIQYKTTENETNVDLVCDEEAFVPKLIFKSYDALNKRYNLEIQSKHACVRMLTLEEGPEGGLSTGSLLVIMLLVLTILYFGGGMLTLKILRGAEGKEMIPNVDFWMDLPYLVRDGILFTVNGFTPAASYDRI